MNSHSEVRLRQQIKLQGWVELTVVHEDNSVTEERHDNVDEAKNAIHDYTVNGDCEVYF